MQFGAAEVIGLNDFAECGLYDWRSAEEDPTDALDHDDLIAEGGNVGPARRASAEHDRELGEALGRQASLPVERAAEMIFVGEDLVLERKECAA